MIVYLNKIKLKNMCSAEIIDDILDIVKQENSINNLKKIMYLILYLSKMFNFESIKIKDNNINKLNYDMIYNKFLKILKENIFKTKPDIELIIKTFIELCNSDGFSISEVVCGFKH